MILETDRLLLRYQAVADIPALVALWIDADVTAYLGGPRQGDSLQKSFDETAAAPFAEPYDLWPVIEKASGQVVGHCGLLDKEVEGRAEIELVYIFAAAVWGKGYATEMAQALKHYAFTRLGLKRLIALIEPENEASARVAAKVGMHLEKEVIRPGGALRCVYSVEHGVNEKSR